MSVSDIEETIVQKNPKNLKTPKKKGLRRFLAFIIFQLVFTCITMPLFIFYGPFETVKRSIVGASWNTLSHQFIAKIFLSDEAIARILGNAYAVDPTEHGEQVQILKFGNKNDDRIDVYNIDGGDFEGKLMVVYNPARINVGYSSQIPKSGETTSIIAKKNGAAAAINAGGFLYIL